MIKTDIEALKPFLKTRPMFGTFALGNGSGVYFCSYCGRRSDPAGDGVPNPIPHAVDCQERAHWRAIEVLKLAMQDAGIDG